MCSLSLYRLWGKYKNPTSVTVSSFQPVLSLLFELIIHGRPKHSSGQQKCPGARHGPWSCDNSHDNDKK